MSIWELYDNNVKDLSLSDYLAIERTLLANERTMLAYVRTSLAMAGAGATLVHFVSSFYGSFIGWFLILSGITAAVTGAIKYKSTANKLSALERKKEEYHKSLHEEVR